MNRAGPNSDNTMIMAPLSGLPQEKQAVYVYPLTPFNWINMQYALPSRREPGRPPCLHRRCETPGARRLSAVLHRTSGSLSAA